MLNTPVKEISVRMSGQNGDGIFSIGETLAKICSRSGLYVHGSRTYQSIIRGGHVSYSVRAGNTPMKACADYIDLLLAIREDSFIVDAMTMMREGGIVLYDGQGFRIKDPEVPAGVTLVNMPAVQMARDINANVKILYNTVFVGAAVAMYGLDISILEDMMRDTFGKKGDEIVNMNVGAARAGYDWVKANSKPIEHSLTFDRSKTPVYIGGNEALAYGMLNGGLQSYAWYPMTLQPQ